MKDTFRRCGISLAFFAILFLVGAANDPVLKDAPSQDTVPQDQPAGSVEPTYSIATKYTPGDVSYYVIENEYRDSGAILSQAFPLSYATTLRERRSIIQRVLEPTTQPSGKKTLPLVQVSWECDRYEVRERPPMSTEDSWYDSLRHTFPPPSLRAFGEVPGSVVRFLVDPKTGKTSNLSIKPGKLEGKTTRRKLSSTGERCRLNAENVGQLLADLGPFYLPDSPKRVGEKWTLTHNEEIKGDLTLITKLTCTLRAVHEKDGHEIATIDLDGTVSLEVEQAAKPSATTCPATTPDTPGTQTTTGKGAVPVGKGISPATSKPTAKPLSPAMTSPSHAPYSGNVLFSMRTDLSIGTGPSQQPPKTKPGAASRPTSSPTKGATPRSSPTNDTRGGSTANPPPRTRTTSRPRRTPIKTPKVREKSKPEFSLKSASCQGTVEFDLTRGELIELHLRRESNLAAKLKSKASGIGPTTIEQGATQTLRVVVRQTPVRKPVIVGGKKPPVIPDRDKPKPAKAAKPPKKTTSPRATPRQTRGTTKRPHRPTTSRPAKPAPKATTPASSSPAQ